MTERSEGLFFFCNNTSNLGTFSFKTHIKQVPSCRHLCVQAVPFAFDVRTKRRKKKKHTCWGGERRNVLDSTCR